MDKLLIRQLAAEMGVSSRTLDPLRTMPFEQATKALDALKEAARALFQKLCLKYHPDRNPDNPDAATKMFVALMAAKEGIESLRVQPRPRPRPRMQRRVVQTTWFVPTGTPWQRATVTATGRTATFHVEVATANTPSGPVHYDARRVIFMGI